MGSKVLKGQTGMLLPSRASLRDQSIGAILQTPMMPRSSQHGGKPLAQL